MLFLLHDAHVQRSIPFWNGTISVCFLPSVFYLKVPKTNSIFARAGTMAYEIYYAIVIPSTTFERLCFFVWFLFDISFATVAITSAYAPENRRKTVAKLATGVAAGLYFLHLLCKIWPDEREQVTAYWTGIVLQLPISAGHLYLLLKTQSTKGQSLEMW